MTHLRWGDPAWLSKRLDVQFGLLKRMPAVQLVRMVENANVLFGVIALLLVVILVALLAIWSAIVRLTRQLQQSSRPAVGSLSSEPAETTTSQQSAFEAFLIEDSSRLLLPKAEQFAEFRKWRREKGMTWSNS